MSRTNASAQIATHIKELADWRGKMLAQIRKVILDAAPSLVEEWKWNTPVWSHSGNVVAAGALENHVKVNFFKGASLSDLKGLFNAGLEAKASRAIDIYEGHALNKVALKDLIRAAVALNDAKPNPSTAKGKKGRELVKSLGT